MFLTLSLSLSLSLSLLFALPAVLPYLCFASCRLRTVNRRCCVQCAMCHCCFRNTSCDSSLPYVMTFWWARLYCHCWMSSVIPIILADLWLPPYPHSPFIRVFRCVLDIRFQLSVNCIKLVKFLPYFLLWFDSHCAGLSTGHSEMFRGFCRVVSSLSHCSLTPNDP